MTVIFEMQFSVSRSLSSNLNFYHSAKPQGTDLRQRIEAGYQVILNHESSLTNRFLAGAKTIPGLKIYGNKEFDSTLNKKRTPTFALRMNCFTTATELAEKLVEQKIIAGAGHFYAKYFAEGLNLMSSGGYVRIGFVHYNTLDEIDKVLTVLSDISAKFS